MSIRHTIHLRNKCFDFMEVHSDSMWNIPPHTNTPSFMEIYGDIGTKLTEPSSWGWPFAHHPYVVWFVVLIYLYIPIFLTIFSGIKPPTILICMQSSKRTHKTWLVLTYQHMCTYASMSWPLSFANLNWWNNILRNMKYIIMVPFIIIMIILLSIFR